MTIDPFGCIYNAQTGEIVYYMRPYDGPGGIQYGVKGQSGIDWLPEGFTPEICSTSYGIIWANNEEAKRELENENHLPIRR